MTRQTAYEKVRDYFQQPGAELCNDGTGTCYYRHPDEDRRCAAGVLIPDEAYRVGMEGTAIASVLESYTGSSLEEFQSLEELKELGVEFLTSIQEAHDAAFNLDEFLVELDERVAQYGVRVPVLA